MKKHNALLAIALSAVLFTWLAGVPALFASPPAAAEEAFVRVAVRFAKARALPDAGARVVREIGFGTMLRVLDKKGDFLRVAPLQAPDAGGTEPWYVQRSDVEDAAASTAQALVETRSVMFSPQAPVAGQPVLFTARGFRTPNLLNWDMGDGTRLTSGGKASPGDDAALSYAYAAPGRYQVKVFDEGGKDSLPPVTAQVTVSAFARSLRVSPALPAANHPVEISALNFREPEKIAWDLGDGTEIKPGSGPGVIKPGFLIRHVYEKAGTYVVKAYDGGDRSQPPLTSELQVVADPRRIRVEPVPSSRDGAVPSSRDGAVPSSRDDAAQAAAGTELEFSAVHFNTPDDLRWDMGDGTMIPSGKDAGATAGSRVRHRYSNPGTYVIRVYDWNGDPGSRPILLEIVTSESARAALTAPRPVAAAAAAPAVAPLAAPARPARKKYNLIKFGPYAGYFQPQDEWFKLIYGDGDMLYGARLGIHVWNGFHAWISLSLYEAVAGTTYTADRTTLTLMPISAFLRFNVGSGTFSPYAGVGYTFMSVKEESEFVGNFKGSGGNIAAEAGFEIRVNRHFFLDLGARFDQIKIKPDQIPNEIDLGGLQAGISLLVSF